MFNPFNMEVFNNLKINHVPYKHTSAENIFNDMFLSRIDTLIENTPQDKFLTHHTGYQFAHFLDKDFIRYIYSPVFLDAISSLFNVRVKPSKKFFIPQIYVFPEKTPGLSPHTDATDPRDLAMIFYISHNWEESNGGHLHILDAERNDYKVIPPKYNSMSCIELFENSWHKVSPVQGNWRRKTLIVDFDYF